MFKKIKKWLIVPIVSLVTLPVITATYIGHKISLPAIPEDYFDTTAIFTRKNTVLLPVSDKAFTKHIGIKTSNSLLLLGQSLGTVEYKNSIFIEREVSVPKGSRLPVGVQRVRYFAYLWDRATNAGLVEEQHTIPTEYGEALAKLWYKDNVNFDGTWVVGVHGRWARHEELVRMATVICDRGMPFLSISHRNDHVGGPETTGRSSFGKTEWKDLDDAVQYAKGLGAKTVIVAGASQGGSVVSYLIKAINTGDKKAKTKKSDLSGVILDAPLLQMSKALPGSLNDAGLFEPLAYLVALFSRPILGLFFRDVYVDINHLPTLSKSHLPTIIFQGLKDKMIPPKSAIKAGRSGNITVVLDPLAGHVLVYNQDPERYKNLLNLWLDKL